MLTAFNSFYLHLDLHHYSEGAHSQPAASKYFAQRKLLSDHIALTKIPLHKPALRMPPVELEMTKAQPTSTILREEGNALYKAGKVPQGKLTSHSNIEIPTVLTGVRWNHVCLSSLERD
jgi:hypothetical protein